ncbi:MAG: urease accessory protein [Paracoccaceae bacterium]|jgi:urease accessory protein
MTIPLPCVQHYTNHAHKPAPVGSVKLDYEARFIRRKVLELTDGRSILVDLPQTTSLNHGGVLVLENGDEIAVLAAVESLLEVTADDLVRVAWHVGNRHTPCQIEANRLVIQRDHVIRDMLDKIGAHTREITEAFTPEGGAYGHGRTHSHAH